MGVRVKSPGKICSPPMLVSPSRATVIRTSLISVARGMTRASFGMPDTSRAARYILKDYVNAKLLFAHPPPGIDVEEFMSTSRERTMARINEEYDNGRKRAPISHVSKNADTYVAPAPDAATASSGTLSGSGTAVERQRQLTTASIRANAASAPASVIMLSRSAPRSPIVDHGFIS